MKFRIESYPSASFSQPDYWLVWRRRWFCWKLIYICRDFREAMHHARRDMPPLKPANSLPFLPPRIK